LIFARPARSRKSVQRVKVGLLVEGLTMCPTGRTVWVSEVQSILRSRNLRVAVRPP